MAVAPRPVVLASGAALGVEEQVSAAGDVGHGHGQVVDGGVVEASD